MNGIVLGAIVGIVAVLGCAVAIAKALSAVADLLSEVEEQLDVDG